MRILLVQPDYKRSAGSAPELLAGLFPARSLIGLGAVLEDRGHEATVLDPLTALGVTGDDTTLDMVKALNLLMDKEDFDAVGISVYTATRKEARELAAAAKKKSPDIPVIAGGTHPTRLAQSMLGSWKEFDYICLGAAEESLPALLDHLSKSSGPAFKVPAVAFRVGPRFVRRTGKPVINPDLTSLPAPRYERYLETAPGGKIERAYVMSALGCNYWCNFCSNLWKKVLLADPEAVADEISHLVSDCGTRQVIIHDDCFGMKPGHGVAVLEAIIDSGVKVELSVVTRFDILQEDWLGLFRKAGGRDVLVGLESGSRRLRRKMNKHLTDDDICRGSELIRKMEFRLGIFLLFGFPGENEQDVEDTYRLLDIINPHQVMSAVFDIKPGDMLFEFALSAQMLDADAWLDEGSRLVNEMSEEEMERAVSRAVAFDRRFSREALMPEHDSASFIQGMDDDKLNLELDFKR